MGMLLCSPLKFGIYIQYVLCHSYIIFYKKIFIFYVNSIQYEVEIIIWLCSYIKEIYVFFKTFVFLLSHFLVNISTTNIDKVDSILFPQRWTNSDKHTLTQFSSPTKYQCWNNIASSTLINVILSMLFQHCFANVETTPINIPQLHFHFQPNIIVETMLVNVDDDQRRFNVDSTLICLLGSGCFCCVESVALELHAFTSVSHKQHGLLVEVKEKCWLILTLWPDGTYRLIK